MSEPITVGGIEKLMADIKALLPNQDIPNAIRCNQTTYDALIKRYRLVTFDKPPEHLSPPTCFGMSIFIDDNVIDGIYETGYNIQGRFRTPIEKWAGDFTRLPIRPIKMEEH